MATTARRRSSSIVEEIDVDETKWCGCTAKFHFAYAIVGIVVGVTAGPVFAVQFGNYLACALAILSAMVAVVLTYVHYAWWRAKWNVDDHNTLTVLMYSGCIGQLVGLIALVAFIVLGVSTHQGTNWWIAAVWGFMTWKWSFQLFWWSRIYRNVMLLHVK